MKNPLLSLGDFQAFGKFTALFLKIVSIFGRMQQGNVDPLEQLTVEHGLDGTALNHQEDTALTNSDVIYSLDVTENLGNNVQKHFWFSYFLCIYSQNTLAVILGDYYDKTLSHPNAVGEVAKEQTNTSRKLGELQPVAQQCSTGFCSKELRQRSSKMQVNRKHDPCCSWGGYCSQNRPRSAQNCLEFIQHSWHEGNTD